MLRLISRSNDIAVTLEEMVEHLRRGDTDEDDRVIERQVLAATQAVENYAGISIVEQVWEFSVDEFPFGPSTTRNGAIWLPRPPLLEVQAVSYRDGTGSSTAFTGFDYYAPSGDRPNKGCVFLSGTSAGWPTTDGLSNAATIRYRAGYMDQSASPVNYEGVVPELVKAAIMIYAAAMYRDRESSPDLKILDQVLRGYRMESSLA